MSDPQRRWTLGLLIGAVGALVLLAGSLPNLQLGPGTGVPAAALLAMLMPSGGGNGAAPPVMDLVRVLLVIIFWVATPILIIALIVWPEFRRSFLRSLPTYIVVTILAYLLLRWLRDLVRNRPDQVAPETPPSAPPTPASGLPDLPVAPSFVNSPPQWLVVLISLLIVAVLAAIIWWLWSRGHQREILTPLNRLTEGAQSALDDLRAGADVRDTVLRCYAEMMRVLHEARGVQRGAGMTAREFEQQLKSAGLGDEHIQRLTRLFERVRYGDRASSARDAREAEACLFALVQSYGKVFA